MKRFVSPNELYLPNSDKYIPDCHKGLKNESCPQWQHLLHSGDWWYPFIGSFQLILNLILLLIFFCILWLIFKVALNVYGYVCMAFFFPSFFSISLCSYVYGTHIHQPGLSKELQDYFPFPSLTGLSRHFLQKYEGFRDRCVMELDNKVGDLGLFLGLLPAECLILGNSFSL